MTSLSVPTPFLWRRFHSLTGIWITLFLIEHLLVNSQAGLFFGEGGLGFIHSVNGIKNLPYLSLIELTLLGIPFLSHMILGIQILFTSKINSYGDTGKDPYLPEYGRNRAYTWQRWTSWFLLFAILFHVIQMRFWEAPVAADTLTDQGVQTHYLIPVKKDLGLPTVAARLGVTLLDAEAIKAKKERFKQGTPVADPQGFSFQHIYTALQGIFSPSVPPVKQELSLAVQKTQIEEKWLLSLSSVHLGKDEVLAISPSFGTAELLLVRETFKNPLMIAFYSLFVLTAVFHAFNGLWTFLITWGVTLSEKSQRASLKLAQGLMVLVAFLGLIAVWGTYLVNLRY